MASTIKLKIYDFDDTLFRIPSHTSAPKTFDITGDVHKWYDHPDSLNEEKVRVQCIETVAEHAKQHYSDVYNHTILITRRVPTLTADIMRILKKHGIYFDKLHIIGHNTNKPDILAKVIAEDLKDEIITDVTIYEDCMYQILDYQKFFEKLHYPTPIRVNYFFVDKTHLIKIQNLEATVFDRLKLSDK